MFVFITLIQRYMSKFLHNGLDREIFDKKALKAFRAVSKFEKFRSLALAWIGVSSLSASRVGALVAPRRLAPHTSRKRKLSYQWLFYVVSLRASRIGVTTSRAGATAKTLEGVCPKGGTPRYLCLYPPFGIKLSTLK